MNKNIAFLDTETTGTNVTEDRIVSISVFVFNPELTEVIKSRTMLINPGRPIPPAATAVHGITDEMVKDAPTFAKISKALASYLEGCDIGGFNIINFDVPLIAEEFNRVEIEWPNAGTLFFDAFNIFREKEKRDLTAAVMFYTGKDHSGAHEAEADVLATVEVFKAQLVKYEDLGKMQPAEIAAFCRPGDCLDFAGKIIKNEAGDWVYSFGKDKGKSVVKEPGFAHWMLKQDFPSETKKQIRKLLGIVQQSKLL